METSPSVLDELILRAQKPSRYVGSEFGAVVKDLAAARLVDRRLPERDPLYPPGDDDVGADSIHGSSLLDRKVAQQRRGKRLRKSRRAIQRALLA